MVTLVHVVNRNPHLQRQRDGRRETFEKMGGKGMKIKQMKCLIAYLSSFDWCEKRQKPISQVRMWISEQINNLTNQILLCKVSVGDTPTYPY